MKDRTVTLMAFPGEFVYLRQEAMNGKVIPREVLRVMIFQPDDDKKDFTVDYFLYIGDPIQVSEKEICDRETAMKLAIDYHLSKLAAFAGKKVIWKFVTEDELDSMKAGDNK